MQTRQSLFHQVPMSIFERIIFAKEFNNFSEITLINTFKYF
jgi:hypothetical protein